MNIITGLQKKSIIVDYQQKNSCFPKIKLYKKRVDFSAGDVGRFWFLRAVQKDDCLDYQVPIVQIPRSYKSISFSPFTVRGRKLMSKPPMFYRSTETICMAPAVRRRAGGMTAFEGLFRGPTVLA